MQILIGLWIVAPQPRDRLEIPGDAFNCGVLVNRDMAGLPTASSIHSLRVRLVILRAGRQSLENMRYLMKQNLFAFGDDFTIKNEAGEDAFFVDGRAFSFGDKLSFQDMSGNELAFISQKIFSWGPTYEIYRGGELAAIVKKELFTLFNCRFSIDVPGPDDLEAKGDFMDHNYSFSCCGREVAQVSKQWFSIRDSYGVDIASNEDDVLILASTVVIDMVCHGDKKNR